MTRYLGRVKAGRPQKAPIKPIRKNKRKWQQNTVRPKFQRYYLIKECLGCGKRIEAMVRSKDDEKYYGRGKELCGECESAHPDYYLRMPLDRYLRTGHWRNTRNKALARAQHKCEECGAKKDARLHVHHLTYKRKGKEVAGDLMVLCKECHRKRHEQEEV